MNVKISKYNKANAPASKERRKTIKKIAVGIGVLTGYSALPEKWFPPIVEIIILPAHAQTSRATQPASDNSTSETDALTPETPGIPEIPEIDACMEVDYILVQDPLSIMDGSSEPVAVIDASGRWTAGTIDLPDNVCVNSKEYECRDGDYITVPEVKSWHWRFDDNYAFGVRRIEFTASSSCTEPIP